MKLRQVKNDKELSYPTYQSFLKSQRAIAASLGLALVASCDSSTEKTEKPDKPEKPSQIEQPAKVEDKPAATTTATPRSDKADKSDCTVTGGRIKSTKPIISKGKIKAVSPAKSTDDKSSKKTAPQEVRTRGEMMVPKPVIDQGPKHRGITPPPKPPEKNKNLPQRHGDTEKN